MKINGKDKAGARLKREKWSTLVLVPPGTVPVLSPSPALSMTVGSWAGAQATQTKTQDTLAWKDSQRTGVGLGQGSGDFCR